MAVALGYTTKTPVEEEPTGFASLIQALPPATILANEPNPNTLDPNISVGGGDIASPSPPSNLAESNPAGFLSLNQAVQGPVGDTLGQIAGLISPIAGLAAAVIQGAMNEGVPVANQALAAIAEQGEIDSSVIDVADTGPVGVGAGIGGDAGVGVGDSGTAGSSPGGEAGGEGVGGTAGPGGSFFHGGRVPDRSRAKGGQERITAHQGEYVINPAASEIYEPWLRLMNQSVPPRAVQGRSPSEAMGRVKELVIRFAKERFNTSEP